MSALKIIFSIALLLIIGSAFFLSYMKFFTKVVISEEMKEAFVLVYNDHIGDYKGTAKIQNDIYYSLLNNQQIETFKGFGIYYDNPQKVPKTELRSIAGCILEKSDYKQISKLKDNGFLIKEIPKQNYIATEFPFKSNVSIILGIFKIYPQFKKYIETNKLSQKEMMEIYDIPNKKIVYLMTK